ncbi:hypothetical protein THRCLA_00119 [Thraustotheca clavata]|uniref:Secreted protein n=1 Tax=Thraustotheca clavata TaxID=74557 RepID=A0A0A7CLR9_9STRA|nr:secreted protein [Thraustotheca clavata]OQS07885.1 hypothetical protein THRCLA_00119 [Thraustotheca clavata]
MKAVFMILALIAGITHGECVSECQSQGGRLLESVCGGYRDRLPRPALYNNCVEAHRLGTREACSAYCNQDVNADSHLIEMQSTVCEKYRTIRPKESQSICANAFRTAIDSAKGFVANGGEEYESTSSSSQATSVPAPSTPKTDKKPEIKIKDVKVDAKPKSMLEAAREEALAAAQASRTIEL